MRISIITGGIDTCSGGRRAFDNLASGIFYYCIVYNHFRATFSSYNTAPKSCKDIALGAFRFFYREEYRVLGTAIYIKVSFYYYFYRGVVYSDSGGRYYYFCALLDSEALSFRYYKVTVEIYLTARFPCSGYSHFRIC